MDFVTVSTGLILPYWMGLPIRYIQLDKELQKGVDSINTGNVYSADEVDTILAKEFGI